MSKICEILKNAKNIAVVGISRNPDRTSRRIANYLVDAGYNVVGVNPNESFTDADGIKVYNSLSEIDLHIDIVDVFMRAEAIPNIIEGVLKLKPNVLWLQLGIRNDEAVKPILEQGIEVIQDACIKVEHSYCWKCLYPRKSLSVFDGLKTENVAKLALSCRT